MLEPLRSISSNRELYVVGHKNPDTDAVVSAIAFSEISNTAGIKAKPFRAGPLQPETRVVLEKVGMNTPELLSDLRLRVRDVVRGREPPHITSNAPLKAAVDLMVKESFPALPVVDEELRVKGVFTLDSFAKYLIRELTSMRLHLRNVPVRNFIEVSGSKLIVGDENSILDGKVYVATSTDMKGREAEVHGQILVVGGDKALQEWGIKSGVSAMIVTGEGNVDAFIINEASHEGTLIITSPHDTYTTLRMLDLSQQVGRFGDVPYTVMESSLVSEVRNEMTREGIKSEVVIDEFGRLKGVIGRADLYKERGKPLVMVDHNEFAQAVDGVDEADIVAVIDHHRIGGDVETLAPIVFRVEPLGSTNTVLWKVSVECGVELRPQLAEAMLYAILSDTLLLNSPTTTDTDVSAAKALAEASGVPLKEAISFMRIAMAANEPNNPEDIVTRDLKVFSVKGIRFGISQVLTTRPENYLSMEEAIRKTMSRVMEERGLKFLVLMITDSIDGKSFLLGTGDVKAVEEGLGIQLSNGKHAELQGVTSRKSQVLPRILERLG